MIINLAKINFKKGIIKIASYEQQLLIFLSVFIKKNQKNKLKKPRNLRNQILQKSAIVRMFVLHSSHVCFSRYITFKTCTIMKVKISLHI